MKYSFAQVRKAVFAGAGAFVTALGTSVYANNGTFTWPIVLTALGSGVVVGLGTFKTKNAPEA